MCSAASRAAAEQVLTILESHSDGLQSAPKGVFQIINSGQLYSGAPARDAPRRVV